MGEYKNRSSKSWFAVFNNPADHGYTGTPEEVCCRLRDEWLQDSPTRSGAWVYCISKDGLHHVHMVLEDIKNMAFGAIKKSYAIGMHFEPTLGKKSEAVDYINKSGRWQEKGEQILYTVTFGDIKGNQGRRNDLNKLYEMLKDGMTDYQILEENPQYMKYINSMNRVRDSIRYEEYKNKYRELSVTYQYGATGQHKTRSVMESYGYENVYRITDYQHPFDNYKGQDIILFEEFYSANVRINDMLNYLDGYPLDLPCRYNNKVACYTKVYINSNVELEKQYTTCQRDYKETWLALLRRIHRVRVFDDSGIHDYGDPDAYLNRNHKGWQHIDRETYEQEKLDLISDWIRYDKK